MEYDEMDEIMFFAGKIAPNGLALCSARPELLIISSRSCMCACVCVICSDTNALRGTEVHL